MPVVVATAAVGWAIATLGWIASPLTARLLNEGFALLGRKASALEVEGKQELALAWAWLALLWEQADRIPDLKNWATELRSAFFDVEDMIDAAKYDVLALANKSKPSSGVKKKFQRLLSFRKDSKLLSKLEKLQEIAKEGSQILESFKKTVDQTMPPTPTVAPTTISRPHHTKVFGRDKERCDILNMLHNEASSDSVIGIFGIAGSGKTTLAQYVCEYEENQSYFSPVIWIDVSRCFDVDKIYRQMLEAALEEQCPNLYNLETLRKKLDAELRDKRFLMVLDGMRKAVDDKRNELIARLNTGTKGSKILVTTWSKDIAMSLGAKNPIKIQQLNEKDFLDLLMYYATHDHNRIGDKERKKLEERGRDIAKWLERSPFAAKEVGRQLHEYSYVKFPIVRELLCPETIRELRQSYKHLDEPVRRCFAYCSMFPRMHPFKPDVLIMHWMAQGFIEDSPVRKMEDIGKEYIDQLVSWSFMQPGGNTAYSDDEWFTIPDMLHELAEEVAGTDCLRVQGNELEKSDEAKALFLSRVRHLFITPRNAIKFKSDIYKMKKLRTLIISSDDGSGITVQVFNRMLEKLRKLRVVQVHLKKLKIPKCVCDLKHLRFLGISGPIGISDTEPILSPVETPKKFGKLYHLQNTDCPPSCDLDFSKVKNKNLRHLTNWRQRDTYGKSSHFKVD